MEFYPVPARLQAGYNGASATGLATVMEDENALEFTGEFIPLLPLGAPATVDWTYGQRVLASFSGTVYLSSPGLVRLVGLDAALVETARATFAMNTRLPCVLTVRQGESGGRAAAAEILYLSTDTVTLHHHGAVAPGETVWVSAEVDFLTLRELPLLVQREIALRRDDELLLCGVPGLQTNENFIALSAYSARLEKWDGF